MGGNREMSRREEQTTALHEHLRQLEYWRGLPITNRTTAEVERLTALIAKLKSHAAA